MDGREKIGWRMKGEIKMGMKGCEERAGLEDRGGMRSVEEV
jgi:hypothetical protein